MRLIINFFSLLIFTVLISATNPVNDSTTGKNLKLFGKGTILTYVVDPWPADAYLFTIEITENSKKGLSYHYMFSHNKKQGDIKMSADVLKNAMKMYNYFDGTDQTLVDQTSGIMSKSAYELLKKGETASITMDEDGVANFKMIEESPVDTFELSINNKYKQQVIIGLTAKDADNEYIIIVQDDKEFPIILYMELGWTINLMGIM